ncbi:hypothetical protein DFH27DRAFT_553478 [Peziza echinospora]|nr:hypothetical protein DFH27DRAFT_553478 [Peziza echinospora]
MDEVVISLIDLVEESDRERGKGATFKLLLTSPWPTVEVRQAFDQVPETLLHMAQLPLLEDQVGFSVLQQQLAAEVDDQR